MKVYIAIYKEETLGVFKRKSGAVNSVLKNILGNHINLTSFLSLVVNGVKEFFTFSEEDMERYKNMSNDEFETFIKETVNGSKTNLDQVLRKFGDNTYEWEWSYEIDSYDLE